MCNFSLRYFSTPKLHMCEANCQENQAGNSCYDAKNLSRYFSSLLVLGRQKLKFIHSLPRKGISNNHTRLILEILEEVGSRNKESWDRTDLMSPHNESGPKSRGSRWSPCGLFTCQKKIKSSLKEDVIYSTYNFSYIILGIRSNLQSKPQYRIIGPKTKRRKKKKSGFRNKFKSKYLNYWTWSFK